MTTWGAWRPTLAELAFLRRQAETPRLGEPCMVHTTVNGWRGAYRGTCVRVKRSGRVELAIRTHDDRRVFVITDPTNVVRLRPAC